MLTGRTATGPGVGRSLGATVGATIGTAVGTAVRPAVRATIGPAVRATIGPAIGTAIGTAVSATIGTAVSATVGTAVSATVGTAVVLTGRALARTRVRGALGAGHVVVVERHGSSDRRRRGHRTETTWGGSTAKIVSAHLLWVVDPVVPRLSPARPAGAVRARRAPPWSRRPRMRCGAPVGACRRRMIGYSLEHVFDHKL